LPQDAGRPWPKGLEDYWERLGASVGKEIQPLAPPAIFDGLRSRAVQIRPEVVAACQAEDLDIIAQRREERFDLIVSTNIFVYYGPFEQALAMQNVSSMLRPGGILLANDELPVLPPSGMDLAGGTSISDGAAGRDAVIAYRRK
jgi:CheR methyltransferase, SAM binding domain